MVNAERENLRPRRSESLLVTAVLKACGGISFWAFSEVAGHHNDDGDVVCAGLILQPEVVRPNGQLKGSIQQVAAVVEHLREHTGFHVHCHIKTGWVRFWCIAWLSIAYSTLMEGSLQPNKYSQQVISFFASLQEPSPVVLDGTLACALQAGKVRLAGVLMLGLSRQQLSKRPVLRAYSGWHRCWPVLLQGPRQSEIHREVMGMTDPSVEFACSAIRMGWDSATNQDLQYEGPSKTQAHHVNNRLVGQELKDAIAGKDEQWRLW